MTKRKNVSLRVSEHPQSEKLNAWLDQQKNIHDSILNVLFHMIDRFGMRNITDYDIQKILYSDSIMRTTSEQPEVVNKEEATSIEIEHDTTSELKLSEEQEGQEEDPFSSVNPENL